MEKKLIVVFSFFMLIFSSCSKRKHQAIKINPKNILIKKTNLNKDQLKRWYAKDLFLDTIPGISLNRAYNSLLKDKIGKEVIVAVIDTEIDIYHKDFKKNIWINKNENPNNNIDDDGNGYIDDINGWNFIGNLKRKNIIYLNVESVRIIQYYDSKFKGKRKEDIAVEKHEEFDLYVKAKKSYNEQLKEAEADLEYGDFLFFGYPKAKAAMKELFPKENYTTIELDSVYKKYKKTNKKIAEHAYFISDYIKYNLTEEWIKNYRKNAEKKMKTVYNLEYFDKNDIDKRPFDITYTNYGNPYVNKNVDELYHGTLIAGLIAANGKNKESVKGVSSYLKIMPLAISAYGNEHDKDIALAIKYAVDNGAKVINMSFGKTLSLYPNFVLDALEYAEKNNVLVVSSAGNLKLNLDTDNNYYPNDNINNNKEVSDNFLLVGSVSHKLDKSFFSYFSNYGKKDVDLFAPGEKIYTTFPNNKYKFDSGTSLSSAITSGVAGLLFSYYPNLTASQVKHILMDSGLKYTFKVATPTKKDKNRTIPFNQLSKSGRVLNAYNALIMADSISKNNKK